MTDVAAIVATCATCRFSHVQWRKGDEYTFTDTYHYKTSVANRVSSHFECRRYAPRGPTIWLDSAQVYEAFPTTSDGDWCGEHQPNAALMEEGR